MHFYLLCGTNENGNEVYRIIIAGDDNTARLCCRENFPDITIDELSDCELLDAGILPTYDFPKGHYLLVIRRDEGLRITNETIWARIESPSQPFLETVSSVFRRQRLLRCRIVDTKAE